MTDFAFYNTAGDEARGLRRAVVLLRRLLRRILRPIFVRQAEIMASLAARLDDAGARIDDTNRRMDLTSDQVQETIAFGWDYVAMARRLAALEDRVEALQARHDAARDDEGQLALPFADFEVDTRRARAS